MNGRLEGDSAMKRQQTWQERQHEQQLHQDHRRKKFQARQSDRTRPAAWQHSCSHIVVGAIRRQLDRINAFNAVVQDQLATVGETLEIGMNRNIQLVRNHPAFSFNYVDSSDPFTEEYIFDVEEAEERGVFIK